MGRPSKEFIARGLASLRERFPYPPPKFAEITLECVPGHEVSALVPAARWERIRGVMADLSDDEIVNVLVDDFFERFGLR